MKILVVGSKGFIGENCVKYFSAGGNEVMGCDVVEDVGNEKNYINLNSISGDFNNLFSTDRFDFCINAAGSAHVSYSFEHPEKDFELNVSLVINLLGAIKNHCPQCRFINLSSAAVYGNPQSLPVLEQSSTVPLSPYGYHKLLSENLLNEYARFFNLKTCSLRIFSAYGEGLRKQLFWDLYNKTKDSKKIRLFGTGFESRDFVYILDLVAIIELVIKNADFKGEVYNVANGEEIFIKDAVAAFNRLMDWNGDVAFSGEQKAGDPINWKASIDKIKSFGYQRKFSFEEGLKRYSSWLKGLK